ncbi:MAG TPA: hypothetical protein VG204_19415 [Terriglobia bacterium]|nr:hypothetical protein [Terriglobia bacterium]
MKTLTRQQLERRKAQAVRFTRDVRDEPERAEEIEDESLQDYAERRRITLSNRNRKGVQRMAIQTRRELLERIEELETENEELQGQLDEIADIVAPGEEGSQEGEE